MFGNNEYWWVAVIVFLLFVTLNAIIFLLRNNPKASYAVAYCVAIYLLVYKIIEYTYWQAVGEHMRFPVEFSAISYFMFGIAIVFRFKKIDSFATFCAMLAGLIYSVAYWVSPDTFLANEESVFTLITAIINHHLLYLGGMMMVLNVKKFRVKDIYQHLIGVGVLVGYSWIIHLFTDYTAVMGKPIIIQITDGSILAWLFGDEMSTGILIGYYILAVVLFSLLLGGFFVANNLCSKRRLKRGLPEDAFPKKLSTAFTKDKVA